MKQPKCCGVVIQETLDQSSGQYRIVYQCHMCGEIYDADLWRFRHYDKPGKKVG